MIFDRNNKRKYKQLIGIIMTCILFATVLPGCIDIGPDDTKSFTYSFEKTLHGWESSGTDLGNPPINWSINRSNEIAYDGNYSVQLLLDNMNDAGKIWIEKEFNLNRNIQYNITISYKFATADYGDVNLFRIIAGISKNSPEDKEDLTFQEDTGYPGEREDGFVWLNKTYNFTADMATQESVFVFLGVWGTWETLRIYFIDDIKITFMEI